MKKVTKIRIKRVKFKDIKHLKSAMAKDHVALKETEGAYWWAAYEVETKEIIGVCGAIRKNGSGNVRYKAAWVKPDKRGKGLYRLLWKVRDDFFKEEIGIKKIDSFCTDMSINQFKKMGYEEAGRNAHGYMRMVKTL